MKLMILAGEPSGDLHSSNLAAALQNARPGIKIFGMGGPRMKARGVDIIYGLEDLAILGLFDVIRGYVKLKKIQTRLLELLESEKPDAVILVDYPDFNLRFAHKARRHGIPLIYYISPQVWAWRKGRINFIKKFIDKMIVIFRFEEDLYKKAGVPVRYVGHPLLDIVRTELTRPEFLQKLTGAAPDDKIIAILPGSRKREITTLLPIIAESAKIIHERFPKYKFLVSISPTVDIDIYKAILRKYSFPMWLVRDETYDIINACDLALVASGTATLETAILAKPMLIIYKLSAIEYLLAKPLMLVSHIGLVNVVAGEKIVPEFVQFKARPRMIADEAMSILENRDKYDSIKSKLLRIKETLYPEGASQKAADSILEFLKK